MVHLFPESVAVKRMTNRRRTLLALFAIAFGLRILIAAVLGTQPEVNPDPITSSVVYAREISSGFSWLAEPYSPSAPGYPALLAVAFALSGGSLWAGIVLQAIIGALVVVVLFHLGEKLGGWPTGLLAAVWFSFSIQHLLFTSLMKRFILESLLLALLLDMLLRPFHRMRIAVVSGIVYSALVYVDPQYLLLFPLAAVFILVRATRHALLNVQYFFLFTSCFLVLLLPSMVRNYVVYKQPIPVALEATRYLRPLIGGAGKDEAVSGRIKEILSRHSLKERFKRNAAEFWRITRFGNEEKDNETGATPDGTRMYWSLRHNVGSIATYGLLLPFFILGIIFSVRERNRAGWFIALTVVYYFLMRMVYGGSVLERLPVEPLITVLACYGILYLVNTFRTAKD